MKLKRDFPWPKGCGKEFEGNELHIRASTIEGIQYMEEEKEPFRTFTWNCGEPIGSYVARYHLKCAQRNGVVW